MKISEKQRYEVGKRPRMKKMVQAYSTKLPQLHSTYAKMAPRPQVMKVSSGVKIVQEQKG